MLRIFILLMTSCCIQYAYALDALPIPLAKSDRMSRQQEITPAQALDKLKAGNKRFLSNQSKHRNYLKEAKMSSYGQFPFATVLNCMDSRSVPEIFFDQGIADIFTLRVAGNVLNDDILGSMEFGSKVAGTKLIVVLGHTSCGAVAGACQAVELGNLTQLLHKIETLVPAVKKLMPKKDCKDVDLVNAIAKANAKQVASDISKRSPILKALIDKGQIAVVAGMHNLRTGEVTFIE